MSPLMNSSECIKENTVSVIKTKNNLGLTEIGELTMYQPVTCRQLLMAENSNCFALHTYLRMCNLKYQVIERNNAEEMSPTGQVPFIKSGDDIISGFDKVTQYISSKGITLNEDLGTEEKCETVVYKSLINSVLYNAETYLVWFEFWGNCRWRVSHMYPWPLNWYVQYVKKDYVIRQQKHLRWSYKSLDQVYKEIDKCLSALCDRLGDNKYFFGDRPSELDAVAFGHLFSMLTFPPSAESDKLAGTVRTYPKLIKLCQTIDREFFKGQNRNKIY